MNTRRSFLAKILILRSGALGLDPSFQNQSSPYPLCDANGPPSPIGYFTKYMASEGGWCFLEKSGEDVKVSEVGQRIIRVYPDGLPRK